MLKLVEEDSPSPLVSPGRARLSTFIPTYHVILRLYK